jgi:hypothetical protein
MNHWIKLTLALTAMAYLATLTACPLFDDDEDAGTCEGFCDEMVSCGDSSSTDCMSNCTSNDLAYSSAGINSGSMLSCMTSNYTCGTDSESLSMLIAQCMASACGTSGSCAAGATPSCCGDGIVLCLEGQWYGLLCTQVCATSDMTYAGSCGTEYQGQQSDSGNPVCWCYE